MNFNNVIERDSRIPLVKKIISSMVSKSSYLEVEVLITNDNKLIFTVFDTAMYICELKNCMFFESKAFNFSEIINLPEDDMVIQNFASYMKLSAQYDAYKYALQNKPVIISNSELRENEEFEKLISLKSADGMKFFKLYNDDFTIAQYIPIFTGFPTLNKADKISIKIIDIGNDLLLIDMSIAKKKIGMTVDMLYRVLDLNKQTK